MPPLVVRPEDIEAPHPSYLPRDPRKMQECIQRQTEQFNRFACAGRRQTETEQRLEREGTKQAMIDVGAFHVRARERDRQARRLRQGRE